MSSVFSAGLRCSGGGLRWALKLQGCWHPPLGSSMGDGQEKAWMLMCLEEQFLRSWSERAQLLDALLLEKVAAATPDPSRF